MPPTTARESRLAAGNNHTCARNNSGAVRCWGDNSTGQLGNGTTTNSLAPVTVSGLPAGITAIAAGDNQTCALTDAGGVRCWGNNANGQLGNGTNTQSNLPVEVTGLGSGVSAIGTGDNHACAGLSAGGVRCWGWGSSGQLGHNAITSSNVPVAVQGLPAGAVALEISAGYRHSCAVLTNGSTWCWGRNAEGQLGNGSTTASRVATQMSGVASGATALVGGGSHTCVVQSGTVKCSGLNGAGQVGNGTTTNASTPAVVGGVSGAVGVAAGSGHSCALTSGGAVKCWGSNQDGELGINEPTLNNSETQRDVVGLGSGQIAISAGVQHVCSMASNGSVRCWGINASGQLGNGGTTRSFTPVAVNGL